MDGPPKKRLKEKPQEAAPKAATAEKGTQATARDKSTRSLLRAEATAPLPLFSHYQTRHHGDVLCPGGSFREGSYDRLMLRGRRHYESAFPWASKVAQGFWQGHPYCGRHRFGATGRKFLHRCAHAVPNAR